MNVKSILVEWDQYIFVGMKPVYIEVIADQFLSETIFIMDIKSDWENRTRTHTIYR